MRSSIVVGLASVAAATACSLIVDTSGYAGGGAATVSGADGGSSGTTPSVPGTCADAGTDPSLVFYLSFDEPDGTTVKDCSGKGHDGQITGAGVTRVAGHTGGAIALDGASGCVSMGLADLALTPPFTIAVWARVDQFQVPTSGDSRQIVSKTTKGTLRGWRFSTDGADTTGVFGLKLGQTSGTTFSLNSTTGQPLGTWVHAAAVYASATQGEIYVNAALVATNAAMPPVVQDPGAAVFVGCQETGSAVFKGALDEVRVYTRALQATEIAALAR